MLPRIKIGSHRTRADNPNVKNVHISFSLAVYPIKFIITAIQRIDREEDALLKRRNLRII